MLQLFNGPWKILGEIVGHGSRVVASGIRVSNNERSNRQSLSMASNGSTSTCGRVFEIRFVPVFYVVHSIGTVIPSA